MAETAADLSDHVFPCLPVRQWVLSVPKRLAFFHRFGSSLNEHVHFHLGSRWRV